MYWAGLLPGAAEKCFLNFLENLKAKLSLHSVLDDLMHNSGH